MTVVLFFAAVLAVALLLVPVTRGSYRQLGHLHLHHWWALVVALAVQITLEFDVVPADRRTTLGFGLLMGSYALLLAFCFVNFGKRGFGVIAVGVMMNTVVIGLNRGMPYEFPKGVQPVTTVKLHPKTNDDLVGFLGGVIVLPAPLKISLSFGDLVIAVGLLDAVFWGSRKPRVNAPKQRKDKGDGGGGGGGFWGDDEPEPRPPTPPHAQQPPHTIDLTEPAPAPTGERVGAAAGANTGATVPVRPLWSAEPEHNPAPRVPPRERSDNPEVIDAE